MRKKESESKRRKWGADRRVEGDTYLE